MGFASIRGARPSPRVGPTTAARLPASICRRWDKKGYPRNGHHAPSNRHDRRCRGGCPDVTTPPAASGGTVPSTACTNEIARCGPSTRTVTRYRGSWDGGRGGPPLICAAAGDSVILHQLGAALLSAGITGASALHRRSII